MKKKKTSLGMTLIEIMLVLGLIGILIALAVPGWIRQRESARGFACQENLSKIDGAKELYTYEHKLRPGAIIKLSDLWAADGTGYLKKEPKCPGGGTYAVNPVNTDPTCSYYGKELFESSPKHLYPQN
jgi:prepilin-type N-terminal cleavage/methylation domain-containing protein